MTEWVEALNLACMLQSSADAADRQSGPSVLSVSSVYNNSFDNSDSGFHQQYPPHQPLYANAPPKPRRQPDAGYSSPGHETAYSSGSNTGTGSGYSYHHQHQQYAQPQHGYHAVPGQRIHPHQDGGPVQIIQPNERRTPDTYGRSKLGSRVVG